MPLKRFQDLSGTINQYVSPSLLAGNQAQLLVNVSQKYFGAWSKRPGTALLGSRLSATNQVRGLHTFNKNDSTFHFHAVHDGTLYVFDGSSWGSQEASIVGSSSEVDFTNYIERHYWIGDGATEYLSSSTESGNNTQVVVATSTANASSTGSTLDVDDAIFNSSMVGMLITNTDDSATRTISSFTDSTTVVLSSAINDDWDNDTVEIYMDGKYLATNEGYMLVSGGTINPLRSYWTGLQTDTIDVAADYAVTTDPPTGNGSFGNGRNFVIFTEENYLVVDPKSSRTSQVDDYGCSSHRSIVNLRGHLYWFDRGTFYRLAYNQAFPEKISLPITNDSNAAAVMNQIPTANYGTVAAWKQGDSYFVAVGDLSATIKGITLNNCVLEFDANREAWSVGTYTDGGIGSVFASFTDTNGSRDVYAGSLDDGAIYKLIDTSVFTDDDGANTAGAVTSTIITKQHEFGDKKVPYNSTVEDIFIKYRAASPITLTYAKDGSTTFNNLTTLPAATTDDWVWTEVKVAIPLLKAITLKFVTTGDFDILEYIINYTPQGTFGQEPI